MDFGVVEVFGRGRDGVFFICGSDDWAMVLLRQYSLSGGLVWQNYFKKVGHVIVHMTI